MTWDHPWHLLTQSPRTVPSEIYPKARTAPVQERLCRRQRFLAYDGFFAARKRVGVQGPRRPPRTRTFQDRQCHSLNKRFSIECSNSQFRNHVREKIIRTSDCATSLRRNNECSSVRLH